MDPTQIVQMGPLLQWGFAGFCLIQFAAGMWLLFRGLGVLASVRDVVAANTAAIAAVDKTLTTHSAELQSTHEEIIRRPCQMSAEQLREWLRRLSPSPGV